VDPALQFSLLLLATVLLNPHMYGYDLVIMAPAMLLLANWAIERGERPARLLKPWMAAAYLAPLAAPLAALTRVQGTVFVFIALWWIVWREARTDQLSITADDEVLPDGRTRTLHCASR
jgi:hypothetical protein